MISLPDPNDRHVVAAALEARASVIVTWNVRHFPVAALRKLGLRRQTPDEFLSALYEAVPALVVASLRNARHNLQKSRPAVAAFLDMLVRQNLVQFAERIRPHRRQL